MQNGVRAKFVEFIDIHEGDIRFMYTDNKGFVTVGKGMKIDTEAERAEWCVPSLWSLKSSVVGQIDKNGIKKLIEDDWKAVNALGRQGLQQNLGKNLECKIKAACERATKLRLTNAGLQKAFDKKLTENETMLRRSPWFQWDLYPGDAQLVLLDLAWWLPGALTTGGRYGDVNFRPLCEACKKFDFITPSKEVMRWEAKDSRKKARQQMFLNAAVVIRLKWPINQVYYPNDLGLLHRLELLQ